MTGNNGNGSIGIQDSTRTVGLLVAFDAAYLAVGYVVFGHLLED